MFDLMTIPVNCGCCDPGWGLYRYTTDSATGELLCIDESGDTELCEELPTSEEHDDAWRRYHAFVLDTGSDPLCEFHVKHSTKVARRHRVLVRNSVGGAVLCGYRKGREPWGEWWKGENIPQRAADYFGLAKHGEGSVWRVDFGNGPARIDDYLADCRMAEGVKVTQFRRGMWAISALIEEEKPRKPSAVARELRKAARKAM